MIDLKSGSFTRITRIDAKAAPARGYARPTVPDGEWAPWPLWLCGKERQSSPSKDLSGLGSREKNLAEPKVAQRPSERGASESIPRRSKAIKGLLEKNVFAERRVRASGRTAKCSIFAICNRRLLHPISIYFDLCAAISDPLPPLDFFGGQGLPRPAQTASWITLPAHMRTV